ncbi:MAG: restriction endonuclease [Ruminococcus flavefaciens]|nr:restriction endonuclease [Ruminococcus flavefaciens]
MQTFRKPEILGDFIYYLECKKHSSNNPVGVGIVRDLNGVINMEKVNGGIITTSYFTKDAMDLIMNYKLDYQIQLHDFKRIKEFLT